MKKHIHLNWRKKAHTLNELNLLKNSLYWDEEWYRQTYQIDENALKHFYTIGWKQGNNPSGLFSIRSYLELNPDVQSAGVNPLLHYERYGKSEGRIFMEAKTRTTDENIIEKSSFWDENWYRNKYSIKEDALTHFCEKGWRLGYDPSPKFSISAYVKQNPDVGAAEINPLLHFEIYGKTEFRLFEHVGFPPEI